MPEHLPLSPVRAIPRTVPLVLFIAVLGISGSGPLVRLSHAEPLAIALWRLGLSMTVVAVILLTGGGWRQWKGLNRGDLVAAGVAGVLLALHFWSWIASIGYTSVAASVVLVNVHPVIVAAGSALFLGERPSRVQAAGIAVSLAGAGLLAWGDISAAQSAARGGNALIGDLLAVVGAITIAGYLLTGRRVRQKLDLWPYVGLVYGACLLTVLLIALARGTVIGPQPQRELLIFTGMALGPMLLGHTGFNWALRYLPAYVVSLVAIAEPIGATALAALLPGIGEQPSVMTLVGGGVVLAGIVLASRQRR